MSSPGVELATAWVRLVPSMDGATDNIVKALAPGTQAAAEEGDKAGKAWSGKVKTAVVAGGAAAVGGTVAAFKGLYDIGSTFDDVTDTIRVGTGLQGDALQGLTDVAKQIGQDVPAEFSQIGSVVADLNTRLGLSGDTMETVASQYLEAGRILGEEVDIGKTSAAFSAFKIEGDEVVGAMDDLFRVSQATGVGMNDLAAGVAQNAPALENLGFGFQDSISLLGSLDKAGLNSTQIMSGLSRGLVNLAKDGEQPADAFKRVTGELQGYIDEGNTAAALDLAGQVFGTRGASQFVGALQSGVLNMNDLMAATGATGDTILGVGGETMDFAERWQMTMNTAMTALEPLATAVFTALGDGLTAAMPMLQDLGTWVSENTETIGIVAGIIGGVLVAAFAAWTVGLIANTVAMLAWPGTWIILGIMALIAALVLLIANWDSVTAFITEVWSGFITWITGVLDGFVVWWNGLWAGVGQFFTDVWNGFVTWITDVWSGFVTWLQGIGDGLASWWNGLWQGIGDFFTGLWNGIVNVVVGYVQWYIGTLMSIIGALASWWNGIWSGIGSFFTGLWNGIVSAAQSAVGTVGSVIRSVVEGIASWWRGIWNGVSSFFTGLWDGIVGAVRNAGSALGGVFGGIRDAVSSAFNGLVGIVRAPINGVIGLVNGAIRALNGLSVSIPDWVPGIGGSTFGVSLPTIPMLADGATILPRSGGTLAVLAEAGRPESVVDTGLMNRALEEGLSGSGGQAGMVVQGPLVHIDELIVDSDERVDQVAQALYERSERATRAEGRVNLEGAVTA